MRIQHILKICPTEAAGSDIYLVPTEIECEPTETPLEAMQRHAQDHPHMYGKITLRDDE